MKFDGIANIRFFCYGRILKRWARRWVQASGSKYSIVLHGRDANHVIPVAWFGLVSLSKRSVKHDPVQKFLVEAS
jgi:hypothetical protein